MKFLAPAIVLFIIGLIISIVTLVKYSKEKNKAVTAGTEFVSKPHIIRISIAMVCFVVAQILLLMNR